MIALYLFALLGFAACNEEELIIDRQNLKYLPKPSTSISRLKVLNSNVTALINLSKYKSVEDIYIRNNNIENIKDSLFEFSTLSNLNLLNLDNNGIEEIDLTQFKYNFNLQYLILKNNHGLKLTGSVNIPLKKLDLSGCDLNKIPLNAFKETSKTLQLLNLSNNNLMFLPKSLSAILPNLKFIEIAGNPISCIPSSLDRKMFDINNIAYCDEEDDVAENNFILKSIERPLNPKHAPMLILKEGEYIVSSKEINLLIIYFYACSFLLLVLLATLVIILYYMITLSPDLR